MTPADRALLERIADAQAKAYAKLLEIVDQTCARARARALEIAGDNLELRAEFLADVDDMRVRLLADAGLHLHAGPERLQ